MRVRGGRPIASLALLALVTTILPAAASGSSLARPGTTDPSKVPELARPHLPGVVLVGFRPGAPAAARAAARASLNATARPISPLSRDAERWELPAGRTTEAAIAALHRDPAIRYAEPAWIVHVDESSDDPAYLDGSLWGVHGDGLAPNGNPYGSGADEAWDRGYVGSPDVYVGVVDTGIQVSHPDLAANVWTNAAEATGSPGVDDDRNGWIDDLNGWDFYRNDASVFDPDEHYHGTHVAGTIGAVGGNGLGVAGVGWRTRLISAKFLGPGGTGSIDAAAAALDYLTALKLRDGLNIVASSNSWGGGDFSQTMLDAIERSGDAGILFVASAGNSGVDTDLTPAYPAGYRCTSRFDTGAPRGWDCVVAVAAIDQAGARAYFTNWGATSVDLGAPGVGILSTYPGGGYAALDGTSMAAPHVSGAAALCAAIGAATGSGSASGAAGAPGAAWIRLALAGSTAPTPSLAGRTTTGGRLDAGRLVDACLPPALPVTGSVATPRAVAATTRTLTLGWSSDATNERAFEIEAASQASGTCGTFGLVATVGADATAATVADLSAATSYCFRVRATNDLSGGSATAWSATLTARTADLPAPYACSPTTYAWVDPSAGTDLGLVDDSSSLRTLPFSFTSSGVTYTQATVSSNGFIRLGNGPGSAHLNVPIPSVGEPNALLAPAWDDWNPSAGGSVRVLVTGVAPTRQWVVTWWNVPAYGIGGSAASFQAILQEGGDVVRFQYADMQVGNATFDAGGSATVGIEDAAGETGTQLGYDTRILSDGSAWRCTAGAVATTPLAISTTSLPAATAGAAYSRTLAATGGTAPYAWAVSGSLPKGLTLSSAGLLSGTPQVAGTFPILVSVTDGSGAIATRSLSLVVGFGKATPANGAKLSNTTRTLSLAWWPQLGAGGTNGASYRWCATTSTKGCTAWSDATSATSASIAVSAGQSWTWQAQVLLGTTWTAANGGSAWRISISR